MQGSVSFFTVIKCGRVKTRETSTNIFYHFMKPFFLFFLLFFAGCTASTNSTLPAPENKLTVVASFYPLAFLAQEIGGEKVEVTNLAGNTEVHEYQPSPQDMVLLQKADIVLFQGAQIEPWAKNLIPDIQKKGITILDISRAIAIKKGEMLDVSDGGVTVPSADIHSSQMPNPHTWLNPVQEKETITLMLPIFQKKDPQNAEYYQKNADMLQKKFADLDTAFQKTLTHCQKKSVIVSHDAFEDLAKRYKFETIPISSLSPEDEPSAERLAELKKTAIEKGITHIVAEENEIQEYTKTLAKEANLHILPINTVETGKTEFFTAMQQNLKSLSIALSCS